MSVYKKLHTAGQTPLKPENRTGRMAAGHSQPSAIIPGQEKKFDSAYPSPTSVKPVQQTGKICLEEDILHGPDGEELIQRTTQTSVQMGNVWEVILARMKDHTEALPYLRELFEEEPTQRQMHKLHEFLATLKKSPFFQPLEEPISEGLKRLKENVLGSMDFGAWVYLRRCLRLAGIEPAFGVTHKSKAGVGSSRNGAGAGGAVRDGKEADRMEGNGEDVMSKVVDGAQGYASILLPNLAVLRVRDSRLLLAYPAKFHPQQESVIEYDIERQCVLYIRAHLEHLRGFNDVVHKQQKYSTIQGALVLAQSLTSAAASLRSIVAHCSEVIPQLSLFIVRTYDNVGGKVNRTWLVINYPVEAARIVEINRGINVKQAELVYDVGTMQVLGLDVPEARRESLQRFLRLQAERSSVASARLINAVITAKFLPALETGIITG